MAINSNFEKAHAKDVDDATWTVLYTTPVGVTSCFIHLAVASTNGGGNVSVRVWSDVDNFYTYTVYSAAVPAGSSLPCIIESNKLVLKENDRIEVKSESAGILFDVQSSFLEDVNL